VMMTHTAVERSVQAALLKVAALDFVAKPTRLLGVEGSMSA
jgi:hypothetical protein